MTDVTLLQLLLSLSALTFLEIILGVDNVVFVSVAASRLPENEQARARRIGIYSGAAMRVLLLFALVWLTGLSEATLFTLPDWMSGLADPNHPEHVMNFTLEDLIFLIGGLFLLAKGTMEIHHAIEGSHEDDAQRASSAFWLVITQMTVINTVFSLDSVITAVGMTDILTVMVAAIVISTIVMVVSVKAVSSFIDKHPTTKMLALSFILLVGVALVADGLGFHIPRGYLYFAIAFSLLVEVFNVMQRSARGVVDQPHK